MNSAMTMNALRPCGQQRSYRDSLKAKMAERVGFEPTVLVKAQRFSRFRLLVGFAFLLLSSTEGWSLHPFPGSLTLNLTIAENWTDCFGVTTPYQWGLLKLVTLPISR